MRRMAAPARILVVEDEPRLAELLRLYLVRDGHAVTVVGDGTAALAAFEASDDDPVDLVVLDLMLPGLAGEAVLTAIRERGDTPVLITSAKRSDTERIAGLRMGADDYLAKPFNPHELTARVAAILRRSRGDSAISAVPVTLPADTNAPPLSFDDGRLVVDPASRRYTLAAVDNDGATGPIEGRLTPGEIGLLGALARRPGAVLTRDQLLEAVTRRPDEVYDRVIDVHVANLRRKLGDDAARPWLIETIPQTGYRLVASPDAR
jgi:DNA-binding response OmpR family regulator